jgi:hypothetical protein
MVLAAYHQVYLYLKKICSLRSDANADHPEAKPGTPTLNLFRQTEITHHPDVLRLLCGESVFNLMSKLVGGPTITFDTKWLRCVAPSGSNDFHMDKVYMNQGSQNVLTLWSPLHDVDLDSGPLVLCLDSHQDDQLDTTYGQIDMDRDLIDPVLAKDPKFVLHELGFKFGVAELAAGDVLIFGLRMLHASAPNRTSCFRISIDTRFQPADEPVDSRFMGENGTWLGNFHAPGATYVPCWRYWDKWRLLRGPAEGAPVA